MRGKGGLLQEGPGLPSCRKNQRRKQTGEVCSSACLPSDMCRVGLSTQTQLAIFPLLPTTCFLEPPFPRGGRNVTEVIGRLCSANSWRKPPHWPFWLLSALAPIETPHTRLTLAYSPCRSSLEGFWVPFISPHGT